MTEPEWLSCSDPTVMLDFLRGQVSNRKYRLFVVACCRVNWQRVSDWRCRRAVEVAERYADGQATTNELLDARAGITASRVFGGAAMVMRATETPASTSARNTVHILRCTQAIAITGNDGLRMASEVPLANEADAARDVFGNPFRKVAFEPAWRSTTAYALAASIYDSRDFGPMPVLADALEEAGCDDVGVLNHCRGDGLHVRGCWVVDMVLGKA